MDTREITGAGATVGGGPVPGERTPFSTELPGLEKKKSDFLDWRFVDDEKWQALCESLNGAGIESMQAKWDDLSGVKEEEVVEEVKVKKPRKKAAVKKTAATTKTTTRRTTKKKDALEGQETTTPTKSGRKTTKKTKAE